MIEVYVLGGTVERQARNIRVRNLHKVRWTPQLAQEIDAAIKELSGGAHEEPLAGQRAALTPQKLEALLEKFAALCAQTKPVNATKQEAPAAVTEVGAA
ncbi:MAG TPA: hypothetical protein VFK14_13065 [Solirubrobacterales bacterium]|nr:hypothetical protein [Solirubrobacterales bacterium]